jgi:hypothetical protein
MANQGELVGGDVLGRAGGLAGDELEVIAGRDNDHGGPDALYAGIPLIALPGGAEEQTAVLMGAGRDRPSGWPLIDKRHWEQHCRAQERRPTGESRMKPIVIVATALGLAVLAPQALDAQMTITPTAGQTAEQTAADQGACETEAAAQTGYHPSQPAPTMQPTQPVAGQRLAGAARGAAVGAVREQRTDAEDREVEDVTEAGARAGAVAGGVRQRQGRRESRRDAAQEQQAQAQLESAYSEAFRACMTTKGYVVQ